MLCPFVRATPQLLALRLAFGVGMGFSMHAAAAFIAETCPASHRGMLICLKVGWCASRGRGSAGCLNQGRTVYRVMHATQATWCGSEGVERPACV